MSKALADFVKQARKTYGLSQTDLAEKTGLGMRFVRDLEQNKHTVRVDKADQLLSLFGKRLGIVDLERD